MWQRGRWDWRSDQIQAGCGVCRYLGHGPRDDAVPAFPLTSPGWPLAQGDLQCSVGCLWAESQLKSACACLAGSLASDRGQTWSLPALSPPRLIGETDTGRGPQPRDTCLSFPRRGLRAACFCWSTLFLARRCGPPRPFHPVIQVSAPKTSPPQRRL